MIPLYLSKHDNILATDTRRLSQTNRVSCPGDFPGQELHAFQAKARIISRSDATFASAGRGGKISASVSVCRANEVSGRLNKQNQIITVSIRF